MDLKLRDKVALITGSSRGIGLATATVQRRHALRVAAETIAGVRGVEEHAVPAPIIPAF